MSNVRPSSGNPPYSTQTASTESATAISRWYQAYGLYIHITGAGSGNRIICPKEAIPGLLEVLEWKRSNAISQVEYEALMAEWFGALVTLNQSSTKSSLDMSKPPIRPKKIGFSELLEMIKAKQFVVLSQYLDDIISFFIKYPSNVLVEEWNNKVKNTNQFLEPSGLSIQPVVDDTWVQLIQKLEYVLTGQTRGYLTPPQILLFLLSILPQEKGEHTSTPASMYVLATTYMTEAGCVNGVLPLSGLSYSIIRGSSSNDGQNEYGQDQKSMTSLAQDMITMVENMWRKAGYGNDQARDIWYISIIEQSNIVGLDEILENNEEGADELRKYEAYLASSPDVWVEFFGSAIDSSFEGLARRIVQVYCKKRDKNVSITPILITRTEEVLLVHQRYLKRIIDKINEVDKQGNSRTRLPREQGNLYNNGSNRGGNITGNGIKYVNNNYSQRGNENDLIGMKESISYFNINDKSNNSFPTYKPPNFSTTPTNNIKNTNEESTLNSIQNPITRPPLAPSVSTRTKNDDIDGQILAAEWTDLVVVTNNSSKDLFSDGKPRRPGLYGEFPNAHIKTSKLTKTNFPKVISNKIEIKEQRKHKRHEGNSSSSGTDDFFNTYSSTGTLSVMPYRSEPGKVIDTASYDDPSNGNRQPNSLSYPLADQQEYRNLINVNKEKLDPKLLNNKKSPRSNMNRKNTDNINDCNNGVMNEERYNMEKYNSATDLDVLELPQITYQGNKDSELIQTFGSMNKNTVELTKAFIDALQIVNDSKQNIPSYTNFDNSPQTTYPTSGTNITMNTSFGEPPNKLKRRNVSPPIPMANVQIRRASLARTQNTLPPTQQKTYPSQQSGVSVARAYLRQGM